MSELAESTMDYHNEPDSREELAMFLPQHVKSAGEIVDVVEIFEVHEWSPST